MAALIRLLVARYRESVLARPYGGVPGGGAARRGSGGRRTGRARGGAGDPCRRRHSQDHVQADSPGVRGSRDGGRRGRRGLGGVESGGAGDQAQSLWSRFCTRFRTRSTEIVDHDIPSFREVFDEVEDAVELMERMEALPGRVYDLGKKLQSHLATAGITLGTAVLLLKGKIQEKVSCVKERATSMKETMKDRLSTNKVRPSRDGDDEEDDSADFAGLDRLISLCRGRVVRKEGDSYI